MMREGKKKGSWVTESDSEKVFQKGKVNGVE